MSQRASLLAALDVAAGEYGVLRITEARRRVLPEATAAVDELQHSLVAASRLLSNTDDEDAETIRELWFAIAIVQDQVRRARAAVEESTRLSARTSGLRAAAQASVASSRRARRDRDRKG